MRAENLPGVAYIVIFGLGLIPVIVWRRGALIAFLGLCALATLPREETMSFVAYVVGLVFAILVALFTPAEKQVVDRKRLLPAGLILNLFFFFQFLINTHFCSVFFL